MKAFHLVLKYHGAGFWSIFNKLMNHIHVYQPLYKITWDVYSPWNTYGQGEVMSKVFEPYEDPHYANYEIQEVVCDAYISEELTGKQAAVLYQAPYDWRLEYNGYWTKYIHLRPEVLAKCRQMKQILECMEKKRILSMLIRHPALSFEQPNGRMPSFEQYDDVIQGLQFNPQEDLLVCMTDLQEAYEYFSDKYGDAIVFPPTDRSSGKEGEAFTSKQGDESSALNALCIALNLSYGDHLIHHTSNIATAALYINPTMQSHFLIG